MPNDSLFYHVLFIDREPQQFPLRILNRYPLVYSPS